MEGYHLIERQAVVTEDGELVVPPNKSHLRDNPTFIGRTRELMGDSLLNAIEPEDEVWTYLGKDKAGNDHRVGLAVVRKGKIARTVVLVSPIRPEGAQ